MDIALVFFGALTGLLVGLTGVGGGVLMTPVLLLLFGVAPALAIGTDLWFVAFTKLAAVLVYHRGGQVEWPIVRYLWLGSIPAVVLTLCWMQGQVIQPTYAQFLTQAIAATILVTTVFLLFQEYFQKLGAGYQVNEMHPNTMKLQSYLTVVTGAFQGVLLALTSVGTGTLGTVMLTYLYPFRLTPPRLVASNVVHAIPLTLLAALGHLFLGNVRFDLLGMMLLGSIPAVLLGACLTFKVPMRVIRTLLALILFGIGFKLWTH